MSVARVRAAVYLRQSLDATGEGLAVSRQDEDCLAIAAGRGWQVVATYTDNSVSASDKNAKRPEYDRMVQDFKAGRFDALICWDLDRLTRQPRQLEDWIEAAEERGLVLVTANGEADLSTDGGRLFARIKASVARAEIERKSTRQKRAALQRSENGRTPLGVRLTGYTVHGVLVGHEAELVCQVFERFHAGDSLRGIAAWLNDAKVPTRHGGRWNPSTVRTMLTNPRYAGRAVYDGKTNGHIGAWQPIVEDWLFDMVQAKLSDPRRRNQVGTDRKYLGSGLYLCAICDHPVRSHTSAGVGPRYRCPEGGHITRSASAIDDLVLKILRERLRQPDLAGLLAAPQGEQAQRAVADVRRLRGRLVKTQADYDADLIDGHRYKAKTAKIRAELATAETAQLHLMAGSGVAGTLAAPDPVAAFDASPLGVQRAVLEFFMTVRLAPALQGHHFDPTTVRIDWRRE